METIHAALDIAAACDKNKTDFIINFPLIGGKIFGWGGPNKHLTASLLIQGFSEWAATTKYKVKRINVVDIESENAEAVATALMNFSLGFTPPYDHFDISLPEAAVPTRPLYVWFWEQLSHEGSEKWVAYDIHQNRQLEAADTGRTVFPVILIGDQKGVKNGATYTITNEKIWNSERTKEYDYCQQRSDSGGIQKAFRRAVKRIKFTAETADSFIPLYESPKIVAIPVQPAMEVKPQMLVTNCSKLKLKVDTGTIYGPKPVDELQSQVAVS